MRCKYLLLILIYGLLVSCGKEVEFDCNSIYLREMAVFPIGVGLKNQHLTFDTQSIVLNETDRITTLEFFPSKIWLGEETYDFSGIDYIVNFASANGKEIHGHTLVYPIDIVNPEFIRQHEGNLEEIEALYEHFITTILTKYKGVIKSYDLANELYDYNTRAVQKTWLRNRFPSDEAYFDFIGRCFRYAHNADPDALLFYNDYGQDNSTRDFEKHRAIISQIEKWKAQGVPIHGYGLQMHANVYRPIDHIEKAMEMAASTGLLIHLSELDVSINWAQWDIDGVPGGVQGVNEVNDDLRRRHGLRYKEIAEAYQKIVPREQQFGITLWQVSDKYSEIREKRFEYPTLFDESNSRKASFYRFAEGLSGMKLDCP
jgi:endo-1,4-beta-xylanase